MKVIAQLGRELQLIKNENKSLTIVFACAPPERYFVAQELFLAVEKAWREGRTMAMAQRLSRDLKPR